MKRESKTKTVRGRMGKHSWERENSKFRSSMSWQIRNLVCWSIMINMSFNSLWADRYLELFKSYMYAWQLTLFQSDVHELFFSFPVPLPDTGQSHSEPHCVQNFHLSWNFSQWTETEEYMTHVVMYTELSVKHLHEKYTDNMVTYRVIICFCILLEQAKWWSTLYLNLNFKYFLGFVIFCFILSFVCTEKTETW